MASTTPLCAASARLHKQKGGEGFQQKTKNLSTQILWMCQLLETLTGPGKQGCSWQESVFEASLESSRSLAGPNLLSAPSIPGVTAQRTKTEPSDRDRRPSIPPRRPAILSWSPLPQPQCRLERRRGTTGAIVMSEELRGAPGLRFTSLPGGIRAGEKPRANSEVFHMETFESVKSFLLCYNSFFKGFY